MLEAIELEVKKHFNIDKINTSHQLSLKTIACDSVLKNDDVIFRWAIVAVNWASDEAQELLNLNVGHYVTVRGFSFVNGFMKKYKQSSKKSTQKSKALRKTLIGGGATN